uniref:Uncharacterized protein n=1 Tax=Arundo donax TaxID=35708 RepID=A0A0A9I2Z9_ARUDO
MVCSSYCSLLCRRLEPSYIFRRPSSRNFLDRREDLAVVKKQASCDSSCDKQIASFYLLFN